VGSREDVGALQVVWRGRHGVGNDRIEKGMIMSAKNVLWWLCSFLLFSVQSRVVAAEWYVDVDVEQPGDGSSWQAAFRRIQEGIEAASESDTVIVAEGSYVENIHFNGKNVALRSTDPADPGVVARTIIDGNRAGPVVTFGGGEAPTCALSGLTIQNGRYELGSGGGIYGRGTHAAVQNNVITKNSAKYGGGLAACNGMIAHNIISENTADTNGGGLSGCQGTILLNTICDNASPHYGRGGGLWDCNGLVENNMIRGNYANDDGGGFYRCHGTICGNVIMGNHAVNCGGGAFHCDATFLNNTVVFNQTDEKGGGGLHWCEGTVRNCIVAGNSGPRWREVCPPISPMYCCIPGWPEEGEGNITEGPRFVDPDNGDLRLLPSSPCIDAGYNDPELPDNDIAGMRRIMYGGRSFRVDIGAREYYVNEVRRADGTSETILTWSSVADRSYSVFYSDNLLVWLVAGGSVLSAGSMTTSWNDNGSATGASPSEIARRFYKILENP
jgi:hypothetical protein